VSEGKGCLELVCLVLRLGEVMSSKKVLYRGMFCENIVRTIQFVLSRVQLSRSDN